MTQEAQNLSLLSHKKPVCFSGGALLHIVGATTMSALTHVPLHLHASVFLKTRCKILNNDPIIFMGFFEGVYENKEQLLIWSSYYSWRLVG